MTIVTFKPSNKTIEVPSGTELLDAARKAEIEIDSPCGGKGTCCKCIVRIIAGEVDSESLGLLPKKAIDNGYLLACQTKVKDIPLTIEIPEQEEIKGGKFVGTSDDAFLVHQEFLPEDVKRNPLPKKFNISVAEPQLEDGLSDIDRLTRTIQKEIGEKEIIYPLSIIRNVADTLRAESGNVTITAVDEKNRLNVVEIVSGDHTDQHHGVAIDIGTTTVAVQLIDLSTARIVSTHTDYNNQLNCGLDVISRINYARKPERLEELRKRVLKTINNLIKQAVKNHLIKPGEISSAAISGNTTMIHLLLGLKPEYIRLEPYTPTLLKTPNLKAGEIGIEINPEAYFQISPAVGSYVGGDITAGLLCTDIASGSEAVNLFLDIGTNGELVIGNRDFLLACACSAGPAFEGGGIKCGLRAAFGAIEGVEIDQEAGKASYWTIGNVKPRGICGSGIISLLANLFLTGWIDAAGKLNRDRNSSNIQFDGRQAKYIIVPAEESSTCEPISISEIEIENIIRAKAAIYSACSLMLKQVGLNFDNLANIYIAGGFGRFIDLEKAIIIGLLPDLPLEKFKYIGNASLMGTYLALISQDFRQRQFELAKRMTYMELSTEPSYMEQYTGALFLPHTDDFYFPSVRAILKK
ncbi:MAG: DUF4445 domain-containing protein [bacterium]|nr:MAG: DUF4445 domain-containing protein [bacterium]